jgi:hypothetical protein
MILIQRFPLVQTELDEDFLYWKNFSPRNGRSGQGNEVGVEYDKLKSFILPLGEPGHPTMKWSFPPVPISSPSLGLSDE